MPAARIASSPIVRFIGQTAVDGNPPFWQPWLSVVRRWLDEGLSPYFFVHTPDNARTPHLARTFHDVVRAMVPGTPELPEPPMTPPDEQMALF